MTLPMQTPSPSYTLHRTLQTAADGYATPTLLHYGEFQRAFSYFNERLFPGLLDAVPECLIVMTRKKGVHGYLAKSRWANSETGELLHELALNPLTLGVRPAEEALGTLVHEMVHAWQIAHGKKAPRKGYHNKEWAEAMEEIGLIPSVSGYPDGKKTGQSVGHYIESGGAFAQKAAILIDTGWTVPHFDIPEEEKEKKKNSRPKYVCMQCGIQAWAKPGLQLSCNNCETSLQEEIPEPEEGEGEEQGEV